MKRWPQFTLRYLLLLFFWWSVVLAMGREVVTYSYNQHPLTKFLCTMFLPLALGPAYGGLVLRMRFGFYAGAVICGLMWLYFVCASFPAVH